MGKIGRREFVKGAAVAIATGALSVADRALVHRAARSLKAKAAVAEDPDPELAPSLEEKAAEFEQLLGQLSLGEYVKIEQSVISEAKLACRDKARRDLLWCGWYPIVSGSQIFPDSGSQDRNRAKIVSMLDDLSDEDLFAVEALVYCLACA